MQPKVNKKKQQNQKHKIMKTIETKMENTQHMTATQRAAWLDCSAGYYDKWYRYNHRDNGYAYNMAWMKANKVYQNDNVQFIECN